MIRNTLEELLVESTAPSRTSQVVDLATSGRVYDLAQPTHAQMPQLPGAPRYALALLRRHGDAFRDGKLSTANELVVSICHAGTHMDALGHVSVDGILYGGQSAAEAQTGVGGLQKLGIESAPLLVRRGILLDAAAHAGVDALPPGHGIDAEALRACAQAAGVEIGPGDVVYVRTGWGQFWSEPDRYLGQGVGLPGVNADGAAWLADQGVVATGADCLMYESFTPGVDALPVHGLLIQQRGVYLIENLNLEPLAKDSVVEFLAVILPLRLVGATGSPVRPIAIVASEGAA